MFAFICDANGIELLGSDSVVNIDGRLSLSNRLVEVSEYKQGFKKHFRHKFDDMVFVAFTKSIRDFKLEPDKLHRIPKHPSERETAITRKLSDMESHLSRWPDVKSTRCLYSVNADCMVVRCRIVSPSFSGGGKFTRIVDYDENGNKVS